MAIEEVGPWLTSGILVAAEEVDKWSFMSPPHWRLSLSTMDWIVCDLLLQLYAEIESLGLYQIAEYIDGP